MTTTRDIVTALESAQARSRDPQARRVLSDERCTVMAARQRRRQGQCTREHVASVEAEARRVLGMWS